MRKVLLMLLISLHTSLLIGQVIKFRIINASNNAPITGATIGSIKDHKELAQTNDSGYFNLKVNHEDTLLIGKVNFHSMFVHVTQNNFDTTHIITLSLVPIKAGQKNATDLKDLSSFQYHFVHDTLGENSHVKIHVFEGYHATSQRTSNNGKSFNIAAIKLGEGHPQKESSYSLKK